MDLNKLIARVKAILTTPKTEWPVIAGEPATTSSIFTGYVMILAAIPPVMSFLKYSVIGASLPFVGSYHLGMGLGLTNLVLGYVVALVGVFVLSLIIDALAPSFGGEKSPIQALKTAAYAYTASWIAGFGVIVPWLGFLIAIAGGVYSIYLLYLGLPNTMKSPPDKAAGYTVVIVIIAVVISVVLGLVVGGITGASMMMSGHSPFGSYSSRHDSGDVQFDKDSSLGKLQDWSKRMEKAGKNMEAAQKSGDAKAQNDALKQVMGAALGGGDVVESLPTDTIKQFVPEELAGLKRSNFSAERNNAMGMQMSTAKATYSAEDGRSINLEVSDLGSAKGVVGFATWAGVESDKETDHGYDKTYHQGDSLVHERWDSQGKDGEYSIVVADRFTVKASSSNVDSIDTLKAAVGSINLSGLAALKNSGVKAQQ